MKRVWIGTLIAVSLLALAGCGGGGADVAESGDIAEEPEEIKRRPADSLPEIDDYLSALDEGRVEMAPPKGWNVIPRKANYLANFTQGKANEFPRISATVAAAPANADDYTEDNAFESAAAMIRRQRVEQKRNVAEPPKPIVLGNRVWVRHVRNPLNNGEPIAIQSLQTIQGGRLYTIELIIDTKAQDEYAAELQKARDFGYTVAAHTKFLNAGDSSSAPAEVPAAAPAEAKPAEGKPAEGKK